MLIPQKCNNLKQNIHKENHIYCAYVIFRKLLQWIALKKQQKNKQTNKKTDLTGYSYDFSVDFNIIHPSDILVIHKFLNKTGTDVE